MATWASLPEYPFIRHTQGRRFEARRRDTVVALEAAPTLDARRAIDGIRAEVGDREAAAAGAVARAMDLARQLRDAATAYDEGAPPQPQRRAPPDEDRRVMEGYVAAVRAAEAAWVEARARGQRAAARIAAGHVEEGTVTVEVGVRRGRKKKSLVSEE
jgi:hypothetical protein